jgi:hypothetical protein
MTLEMVELKQYQMYQTNGMPKIRTLADSQYYVSHLMVALIHLIF